MVEQGKSLEPKLAFREPWHAHVFALTLQLSQTGHFAWAEWTAYFGARLKTAADGDGFMGVSRPVPEAESATYYDVWLEALESLLIERGLASAAGLMCLKEAWAEAYLNTPHGTPVALPAGRNDVRIRAGGGHVESPNHSSNSGTS